MSKNLKPNNTRWIRIGIKTWVLVKNLKQRKPDGSWESMNDVIFRLACA